MKIELDPLRRRGRGRLQFASGGVALALMMSAATTAWAKEKTVGVYVEGPAAHLVRDALTRDVPEGLSVADAGALARSLTAQGEHGPFTRQLEHEGMRHDASIQLVRRVAASMGLEAVLVARVAKAKANWRVRLWVVEASGDEKGPEDVVLDASSDPAHDADLKSTTAQMLKAYEEVASPKADEGKTASAPPPPAPGQAPAERAPVEASAEATPSEDASPHRPHGLMSRALFDVELAAAAAGRRFDYSDGLSPNLRSYNVLPVALFSASLEFFPLAEQNKGVLRDVGVIANYARSAFLESSAAEGIRIPTVENAFSGGLRVRIHPWGDSGSIIGISDSYAEQSVTFDSAGGAIDHQAPAVDYRANRTGADVRVPFGRFAVLGGAGFRVVFDAGPVGQRFGMTSVNGVDVEIGVALKFAAGWEARITGDYERYFYAFKPAPGDAYVAGGALDQFYGGALALACIY